MCHGIGSLSIAHSIGMWANGSNTIMAGTEALLSVSLKDAYNNTVDDFVNFNLSFKSANDSDSSIGATTRLEKGNLYESVGFNITSAGAYTLAVEYNDTNILGSPFSFRITPGKEIAYQCFTCLKRSHSNIAKHIFFMNVEHGRSFNAFLQASVLSEALLDART